MPTILPITDFLDPQLDIYARLSENQLLNRCDPQNGIFIAESPKVIERALDAGCIPISFLTEDRHLENQAVPFLERWSVPRLSGICVWMYSMCWWVLTC